ncbi:MAG: hypothetical protein KY469_12985 [Actinobacteria bacterium]|nr:hypothetical protein [Actinomycetota bacterium]
MRRVLLTLPLIAVALWLSALPALATEAEAGAEEDIDGILLALILGVIVGAGLFVHAYARGDAAARHEDTASDEHH